MTDMTLGQNICRLRTERGLSQGDLADALDVSRQSISKWETDASVPELEKLLQSPPPDRNSIGLSNVSERLRLQYGGAGVFRIESSPDDGTCICLELPTTGPEKA